jgi:hypothetical protein
MRPVVEEEGCVAEPVVGSTLDFVLFDIKVVIIFNYEVKLIIKI